MYQIGSQGKRKSRLLIADEAPPANPRIFDISMNT
jgi:hypothetical protein